jgi:hypothetical protein
MWQTRPILDVSKRTLTVLVSLSPWEERQDTPGIGWIVCPAGITVTEVGPRCHCCPIPASGGSHAHASIFGSNVSSHRGCMFIQRFRRTWCKRLRRDAGPRRCVWRNDQLGRSVGKGGLFFNRRKRRHGRKRLGRQVFDGRCSGLGWRNGWNDSRTIGRRDRLRREVGGNGWNDSRAIGRRERTRREVGAWWPHR